LTTNLIGDQLVIEKPDLRSWHPTNCRSCNWRIKMCGKMKTG